MKVCLTCSNEIDDDRDDISYIEECPECLENGPPWHPSFHFQPRFSDHESEEAFFSSQR